MIFAQSELGGQAGISANPLKFLDERAGRRVTALMLNSPLSHVRN